MQNDTPRLIAEFNKSTRNDFYKRFTDPISRQEGHEVLEQAERILKRGENIRDKAIDNARSNNKPGWKSGPPGQSKKYNVDERIKKAADKYKNLETKVERAKNTDLQKVNVRQYHRQNPKIETGKAKPLQIVKAQDLGRQRGTLTREFNGRAR